MFPCLCHIIDLIVKRFVLNLYRQTLELDDFDEYNDEQFDDIVQKTRSFVAKVKNFPLLEDKLGKIQIEMSCSSLSLIRDNATRWNSLLDMLVRFLHLRTYLKVFDVEGDLEMYNWEALQSNAVTSDHAYNPLRVMSFSEFMKRSCPDYEIDIILFL